MEVSAFEAPVLVTDSAPDSAPGPPLRGLEPAALAATQAAALACQSTIGRGRPPEADAAATEAMRAALSSAPGLGTVVVGEGAKDEAPMLFDGEQLGLGNGPHFDIAVDPLECTNLCAKGLPGSLATIAFAQAGTMASIAASYYMDKLVGPPALRGALDISDPPEANLERAAAVLGKPMEKMRVVVLDKPRHEGLIERLHRAGAIVISPSDGDVAGALATLVQGGGADLLMGVGGTPEGVITACAARALGGCMQARLAPQTEGEAEQLRASGLDATRVYELDELTGEGFFVATGVTDSALLKQPWHSDGHLHTDSLVIGAGAVRTIVEAQPARECV